MAIVEPARVQLPIWRRSSEDQTRVNFSPRPLNENLQLTIDDANTVVIDSMAVAAPAARLTGGWLL